MAKKYDITALGEILIDFVPDGTDSFGDLRLIRKAGGAPLNMLATASKAGLRTAFIGKVGDDLPGKFLAETVRKCNIDDSYLKTDPEHNTTLAFVELDQNGDRKFSFYRSFGADRFITQDDIDIGLLSESSVFHFGSLSLIDEPSFSATLYALKKAKENRCVITYDPNYRQPLWKSSALASQRIALPLHYVDIIKLSIEELEMISNGKGVDAVFSQGVKIILVTDGGKGADLYFNGQSAHIPAINVKAIDTTGAGDIFFGTFVSQFVVRNLPIDELSFDELKIFAQNAVYISGKSTEKYGAIASIPDIIRQFNN